MVPMKRQCFHIFSLVLLIYGVYWVFSNWPPFKADESKVTRAMSICDMNSLDLASVIWSHRGTYPGTVDASPHAISKLLEGGIYNFDVDVTLKKNPASVSAEFIVAHPSSITSQSNLDDYQSVSALLDQVYDVSKDYFSIRSSLRVLPFVTLEPKFQDSRELINLLNIVGSTRLGQIGHAAIIVRNVKELDIVKAFYKSRYVYATEPGLASAVAIAYRSHRNTSEDFVWNLCQYQHSKSYSIPRLCNLNTGSVPMLRQINMPDIKLLSSTTKRDCSGVASHGVNARIERSFETAGDPIVAWIIDTEDELWRALDSGADAVISNNPLKLKSALIQRHAEMCKGNIIKASKGD